MQAARWGVISFFTLSRSIGKIFCTKASSCCLNSSAGYLASTCAAHHRGRLLMPTAVGTTEMKAWTWSPIWAGLIDGSGRSADTCTSKAKGSL